MNALPYYQCYPRDFLEGTHGMGCELRGFYAVLLHLIYLHGGRLEDDDRGNAHILEMPLQRWRKTRAALIARGKIVIVDEGGRGFIHNFRADKEQEKQNKYREKMRENGLEPHKNNGLDKPTHCNHNQSQEEERKKERFLPPPPESVTPRETQKTEGGGGGLSPPFGQIFGEREAILQAIGADLTTGRLHGQVTRLGTPADMIEVARWLAVPGLTLPLICDEIAHVMAGRRGGPPSSFKYFSPALQRLAGKIEADPLAPASEATTFRNGGRHDRAKFDNAIHALADGFRAGTVKLRTDNRDPFAKRSG